jgi:hypothetical protein
MKTPEQLQAAIDDLRIVCNRHGIILIGTCRSEGIYGEIYIGDAALSEVKTNWSDPQELSFNTLYGDSVDGIGDMNYEPTP